jgi:hypothetical protein
MDIFWAIVGALLTAWNWFWDTTARIGLTNWLLMFLIYEVYEIREAYFDFESAKLARYKRTNWDFSED